MDPIKEPQVAPAYFYPGAAIFSGKHYYKHGFKSWNLSQYCVKQLLYALSDDRETCLGFYEIECLVNWLWVAGELK